MLKLSDKRTYTLYLNDETILEKVYVTKVRNTNDSNDVKDDKFVYYDLYTLDQNGNSIVTQKKEKLSQMNIVKAVPRLTSTDFFTMHFTYENWKRRDKEFSENIAIKIYNTLMECGVENIGSGKFEEYDIKRLQKFLLDLQVIDSNKADNLLINVTVGDI